MKMHIMREENKVQAYLVRVKSEEKNAYRFNSAPPAINGRLCYTSEGVGSGS